MTPPNKYILTSSLRAFSIVAPQRMQDGFGVALLLEGPPGGGKTSFAKFLAQQLQAEFFFYSCNEHRNTDLLYRIDVKGVVERKGAWVKGPAWQAFEGSQAGKNVVLLIDELDKASSDFDAFLLRLLEEWSFEGPEGQLVSGDQTKVMVVLTTNGRRKLHGEVLRRGQRIQFAYPTEERMQEIVFSILGWQREGNEKLVAFVAKIGCAIFKADAEQAPSPKELAMLCLDAVNMTNGVEAVLDPNEIHNTWQQLALSHLLKGEQAAFVGKALKGVGLKDFNWVRALRSEAKAAAANH